MACSVDALSVSFCSLCLTNASTSTITTSARLRRRSLSAGWWWWCGGGGVLCVREGWQEVEPSGGQSRSCSCSAKAARPPACELAESLRVAMRIQNLVSMTMMFWATRVAIWFVDGRGAWEGGEGASVSPFRAASAAVRLPRPVRRHAVRHKATCNCMHAPAPEPASDAPRAARAAAQRRGGHERHGARFSARCTSCHAPPSVTWH
jgi:hypothetical protein